jgi:stage V sporulation protein B
VLSELAAKKKEEKFVETLTDASGIVAFFALPATVAFASFSNEILIILFDQGSVALGGAMLSLLSPSVALIALLTVINTSLEAKGGYTVPLISMSVGGVVKLLASSFSVGKTDLAIWGAPLGTAISYAVSILVSILIFRKSGGRILGLLREFLLSTFCAAIASLPVILMKDRVILSECSPIRSLTLLFIYAFLYLLLSFLCGTISIRRLKNMAK